MDFLISGFFLFPVVVNVATTGVLNIRHSSKGNCNHWWNVFPTN